MFLLCGGGIPIFETDCCVYCARQGIIAGEIAIAPLGFESTC
jgi:hypothetical protein